MAWATASGYGAGSPKPVGSTGTYHTNPYETPTYGGGGGDWYSQNKERLDREAAETNAKHDEYMKQFQNKPAAPKAAEPPPAAPPPAAPKPDVPDPGAAAMGGLSMAIGQSGPTPGWADDPALQETSGSLGNRVGNDAMGVLSELVSRRGRLY